MTLPTPHGNSRPSTDCGGKVGHTEGPWAYGAPEGQTGPTTPSFKPFCGGEKWPYEQVTVGLTTVAIVPAPDDGPEHALGNPVRQEAVANARLIAAAPDLLEALQELAAAICAERSGTDMDGWMDSVEWVDAARENAAIAISKALGESTLTEHRVITTVERRGKTAEQIAAHYAGERRKLERELQPLFRNAPPGVAQDTAAIKALATILMLGAAAFAVTWFVAALIAGAAA